MKYRAIITGGDGQLGQCLQESVAGIQDFEFYFLDKSACDITSRSSVSKAFYKIRPHYVINAAAYTAVDKAESDPESAFKINAYALRNITQIISNAKLIHISSDYVYHHKKSNPINEQDPSCPKGVYAKSKLLGEQIINTSGADSIIIRTSWLYSEYGENFLKTMIRLSKEKHSIAVVNDQIGSPTYGIDLAHAILKIMVDHSKGLVSDKVWKGVYNFSNRGEISWYSFASEIFKNYKSDVILNSIPSVLYPTSAIRPEWSVLNTQKIENAFNIKIIDWNVSLLKCISNLVN